LAWHNAVIEAAEKSGELKPGQTVIEATSGNTGIGLAMVCAAKGYPLVVTMAEPFSVERRKLMRFLGAKVIVTPAAERAVGMITKTIGQRRVKYSTILPDSGWIIGLRATELAQSVLH
jgi:cysteine synthase